MMELRNCPFCGGKAIMKLGGHYDGRLEYTPQCSDKKCPGRITKIWLDHDEAVAAWNRRVGDDLMERMEDDGR